MRIFSVHQITSQRSEQKKSWKICTGLFLDKISGFPNEKLALNANKLIN